MKKDGESMTPLEKLIESNKEDFSTSNSGWRALLSTWDWHTVIINLYQGWDHPIDDTKDVSFVMFEHTDSNKSKEMAGSFDDIATGLFYYRDWTRSGLPFTSEDGVFWSGFWFQKLSEAKIFHDINGGIVNWENDFEEKRLAMVEMGF